VNVGERVALHRSRLGDAYSVHDAANTLDVIDGESFHHGSSFDGVSVDRLRPFFR